MRNRRWEPLFLPSQARLGTGDAANRLNWRSCHVDWPVGSHRLGTAHESPFCEPVLFKQLFRVEIYEIRYVPWRLNMLKPMNTS